MLTMDSFIFQARVNNFPYLENSLHPNNQSLIKAEMEKLLLAIVLLVQPYKLTLINYSLFLWN